MPKDEQHRNHRKARTVRNRTRWEVASDKSHRCIDCARSEALKHDVLMEDIAKAKFVTSGLHELLKASARLLYESQSLGRGCKQSLRIRATSQAPNLFIIIYHCDRSRILFTTGLTLTQDFGRSGQTLLL